MAKNFTYRANSAHIVFGTGSRHQVADKVRELDCKRALVVSTRSRQPCAERLYHGLDDLGVGIFSDAAMHTPVEVTERALETFDSVNADCVVAIGGGSTVGLSKAIALHRGVPQIVIATTYAGSEVTAILGQTDQGVKTTFKDTSIVPEVVIYDAELTLGLPVAISVTSGLNAMAHAIEGLYAENRNPITDLMAVEGIRSLKAALPAIVEQPDNTDARSEALYGAWLCGTVLGTVGMSLHHKLCHTLGGSFGLPHSETHAALLPHTAAYNAKAAEQALAPAAALFDDDLPGGLYDFAKSLGAPLALNDLGLLQTDLDRAADLAVKQPYWNPQPVERDAVRTLLETAWKGCRPEP